MEAKNANGAPVDQQLTNNRPRRRWMEVSSNPYISRIPRCCALPTTSSSSTGGHSPTAPGSPSHPVASPPLLLPPAPLAGCRMVPRMFWLWQLSSTICTSLCSSRDSVKNLASAANGSGTSVASASRLNVGHCDIGGGGGQKNLNQGWGTSPTQGCHRGTTPLGKELSQPQGLGCIGMLGRGRVWSSFRKAG